MKNRYEIKSQITEDGVSITSEAWDARLSRPVIVRELKREFLKSEAAEKFHRKYRLFAKLLHPNSIEVYSIDFSDRSLLVIAEPVVGDRLDAICQEALIGADDFELLVLQTLSWAKESEKAGGENLFVQPKDVSVICEGGEHFTFKICDFEFAEEEENMPPPSSSHGEAGAGASALLRSLVDLFCFAILGERFDLRIRRNCPGSESVADLVKQIWDRRPDLSLEKANWLGWLIFEVQESRGMTAGIALAGFSGDSPIYFRPEMRLESTRAGHGKTGNSQPEEDDTAPVPLEFLTEDEADEDFPAPARKVPPRRVQKTTAIPLHPRERSLVPG